MRRFPYLLSLVTAAAVTIVVAGCGRAARTSPLDVSSPAEAWNASNDPRNLRGAYQVELASLPKEGELTRKPWTDTYWPSYRGGIASRWNDPSRPDAFTYPLQGEAQLRGMSLAERANLSPAEKYDAFVGRFDYPLVAYERRRTSPDDPTWFGLCHGWAPAALNFGEPAPVTLKSPTGLEIPFGSSDVKALLTYAQQDGRDVRFLGERCDHDLTTDPGHADDPECRDTNAGSFHIVVANELGLNDRGFVAEVSRDYQVWNQPVYGFTSEVRGESTVVPATAAPGTAKLVTVRTVMRYIAEAGPQWDAMPFDAFPAQSASRTFDYDLELDSNGTIIGGEWRTGARPDFMWTQAAPAWTGYFRQVKTIYEAATAR